MTDIEKIQQTLDKVVLSMDIIQKDQAAMKLELAVWRSTQAELCKISCKQRETHDKILFGNSNPGLVKRIQTIEDKTPERLAARLQEVESKVVQMWLGTVAFVGLVGKLFWDLIIGPKQ